MNVLEEQRYIASGNGGNVRLAQRTIAEIERLYAALQRIDAINDNPADFNSEINAVLDEILRPDLPRVER